MNTKNIVTRVLGAAAAATVGMHVASMLTVDREVSYPEAVVRSPKLAAIQPYRAAFITDLHHYSFWKLQQLVRTLGQRDIHLLLLGGDFADQPAQMRKQLQILATLQPRDGIFAVDGNHDRRTALQTAAASTGIHLLTNTGITLPNGIYLCGVADYRTGLPKVQEAISEAAANQFVLMLSHNPDVTMEQDMAGVDLTLCGHTHGGQVSLFGIFRPALPIATKYGRRFAGGFTKVPNSHVYVSRGVGWHGPVPRIWVQPEVTVFNFTGPNHKEKTAASTDT